MRTRWNFFRGALVDWWRKLSPTASDAWLYAVSAVFALAMALFSGESAQWHWGYLALGPFVLATLLAAIGPRRAKLTQSWRLGVLALTFVGVVAMPLAVESTWHSTNTPALAQPEVGVIQRAGADLANGKSPYQGYVDHDGHLVGAIKGVPAYESFFPYLPWMGIFGLPSAVSHLGRGLTDARIVMSVFTCLLLALALALLRAPPGRKIRVAQVLVVLPSGSLFLATGGDDMPILALCLLALVALQRHRAVAVGIILGVAGAMKLTAWPFALAVLAVARDERGRRSWRKILLAMGIVMAVAIVPYVVKGPSQFVANVVAFPLGLSGIASPAASPLPGHLLTSMWPPLRHVLLPAVFLVGGYFLARYLRRAWPLELPGALRVLAIVMAVVICSATATRLGYVIYPLNFLLWAWVFTPVDEESRERVVLVDAQGPHR